VHNNMGLGMPGWGALHRLIHVCGRQVALRLLAFGETVHLDEAKALGLVAESIVQRRSPRHDDYAEAGARFSPGLHSVPK